MITGTTVSLSEKSKTKTKQLEENYSLVYL